LDYYFEELEITLKVMKVMKGNDIYVKTEYFSQREWSD